VTAQRRPFWLIIHRDGLALVNVLCCHLANWSNRLEGMGSIGMEVHGNGWFRGQWVIDWRGRSSGQRAIVRNLTFHPENRARRKAKRI
jgi:hypothetical protein